MKFSHHPLPGSSLSPETLEVPELSRAGRIMGGAGTASFPSLQGKEAPGKQSASPQSGGARHWPRNLATASVGKVH